MFSLAVTVVLRGSMVAAGKRLFYWFTRGHIKWPPNVTVLALNKPSRNTLLLNACPRVFLLL